LVKTLGEFRESPAPHPGSAEHLHEYWVHGEGAARIRWGTPGDFDRCTRQLEEHAHFTPEQAHGYCNLAHHAALGIYPATHAKLMGKHRSFNPTEHPRVPAGSGGGGEFTTGGGGDKKPAPGHKTPHQATTHQGAGPLKTTLTYDPKRNRGAGYGVKGGDPHVHALQQALNRLGVVDLHGKRLADDGKLGPLTTQAIKAAQEKLGLKPDGRVTPELYARLVGLKALPNHRLYGPTGEEFVVFERAQMSTSDINNLPDADFAYIEPGGSKDPAGKTVPRSLRHFPINDADHVRDALARAPQSPFGDKAMPKILAAAKKFGIDTNTSSGRSTEEHGMSTVERRFTTMTVELRTPPGEASARIGGYAAMFNRTSQNLGGFVEVVERSFFNKSRGDGWPDVMCRYNHDDNMLLGTTGAGTLRLSVDDTGLDYNVTPPQSRADVLELVQRGDIRKSSFAFRVPNGGEDWGLSEQGYPMRHLLTGQLVDVAPVNVPAYMDTSVGLRALEPAEVRRLGLGPDAAYESLARRMEADIAEVRSLAALNELRRFFVRTDNVGPAVKPKPRLLGAAAAVQLLARKSDPWE
jgi:HK97 family phage prohead protease